MTNEILKGFYETLDKMREQGIEVPAEQISAMEILIGFTTNEEFREKLGDYVYEETKKSLATNN